MNIFPKSVLAILSGLMLVSCGTFCPPASDRQTPEARVVTDAESGGNIALAVNQPLIVRLSSNPTTGYRWMLSDPADKVLKMDTQSTYEQEGQGDDQRNQQVGAGGIETWRFLSIAPGRQTLRFEYRRPWEKGVQAQPARVVFYTVTVR